MYIDSSKSMDFNSSTFFAQEVATCSVRVGHRGSHRTRLLPQLSPRPVAKQPVQRSQITDNVMEIYLPKGVTQLSL